MTGTAAAGSGTAPDLGMFVRPAGPGRTVANQLATLRQVVHRGDGHAEDLGGLRSGDVHHSGDGSPIGSSVTGVIHRSQSPATRWRHWQGACPAIGFTHDRPLL